MAPTTFGCADADEARNEEDRAAGTPFEADFFAAGSACQSARSAMLRATGSSSVSA